jgi:hypothetical protein
MSKGGALVRFHDWRTARDHKAATRHFGRCRCNQVSVDGAEGNPAHRNSRSQASDAPHLIVRHFCPQGRTRCRSPAGSESCILYNRL